MNKIPFHILMLVLAIIFLAATSVVIKFAFNIENPMGLKYCLTNECYNNFKKLYENPIEISAAALDALNNLATSFGVIIALYAYFETKKQSTSSDQKEHKTRFISSIENLANTNGRINASQININTLYKLIFPHAHAANFKVSSHYEVALKEIESNVNDSSTRYGSGAPNINWQTHKSAIVKNLLKFGISMDTLENADHTRVETAVFEFIDDITLNWTSSSIQLGKLLRAYAQ